MNKGQQRSYVGWNVVNWSDPKGESFMDCLQWPNMVRRCLKSGKECREKECEDGEGRQIELMDKCFLKNPDCIAA